MASPLRMQDPGTIEGTVDSGGGRAVVCRAPNDQITSARMLDLFESTQIMTLQAAPSEASLNSEWARLTRRVSVRGAAAAEQVSRWKDDFFHHVIFKSEQEMRLKRIDDSKEVYSLTSGCQIEQLANWQDDETILVQKEIWDVMSPRDQAALIAHEFIYNGYRQMGYRDSTYVRRVVGILFSTKPIDPPAIEGGARCVAEGTASGWNNAFSSRGDVVIKASRRGITLNFINYPNQLLLEPLSVPLTSVTGSFAGLKRACEAQGDRSPREFKAEALTSYFKDHLEIRVIPTCEGDLSFHLKILSARGHHETTYRCEFPGQD